MSSSSTDRAVGFTPPAATIGAGDLRSFGLVMAACLGALAAWGVWRPEWAGGPGRGALLAGAAVFGLCGLLAPAALRRPRALWMALGERLGVVVTTVILSVFYFVVITPIGVLRRLAGADPMGLRRAPEGEGYWRQRPPDERGPERYRQQF